MRKVNQKILVSFFLFLVFFSSYLFLGKAKAVEEINWGVVFSQKHAQLLGLDWKEVYLAILDELEVRNIKIITHWNLIEAEKEKFNFEDLDWQINEAEKRGAKIILVIGMKTGRWPECHIPSWAKYKTGDTKYEIKEEDLLKYLEILIGRYKNSPTIWAWQIENEPFFPFGECPKIKKELVKKEIKLTKSLDSRPIIFGDSGEFSFWINAAKLGDIVGTTLHRKVYFKEIGKYISYPFPPVYYWRRAKLIEIIFKKKVINTELQAEPWCKNLIYNCSLEEQKITMDIYQFKKNVEFAKKTGFDTFYFWGVEWWYWLKNQGENSIWQEAKKFF